MEMNTMMSWDHKKPALINELTHGKDLVKQLKIHLDGLSSSSSSSSSSSTIEFLITKILTSFDKAILMMNGEKYSEQGDDQLITGGTSAVMAISSISPNSVISGSAGSSSYYNSDFIGEKSKRRKRLPRWTEKARVCMETGFEGPPDDGYDWRKYGQKDILATKYPRSYYRCTHRSVQGCLANKQVQRSDEDPSVFNITYEGRHTCTQQSDLTLLQGDYSENNQRFYRKENQEQMAEQQKHKKAQEIIIDFQQIGSEVVKIKEIDINEFTTATSSFSFPSKSSIDCCYENENNVLSSLTLDTNFMGGSFSPPFVSPRTSEPNFFSSSSNSPNFDLAVISFEPVDYQSHFLLDSPRIF